jgi:IgA Peptidase M64
LPATRMRTRIFATTLASALFCTAAAFSQTPSEPTSTNVIVATVRVLSPTDPADRFEITEAAIRQGVRPRSQPGEADSGALQAGSPELRVLSPDGTVLHRQPVTWSRVMTVPPPAPGTSTASTPNSVVLERPEVTMVMPAPAGAARLELFVPGAVQPAAAREVRPNARDSRLQAIGAADPVRPGSLNILLLASGFPSLASFASLGFGIQNLFLNAEPFKSNTSRVVFRAALAQSDLGCSPGCSGIPQLMCCNTSAVVNAALASQLPFDEIVVVHNTPNYSGGGFRDGGTYRSNSYNTFTTVYNGIYTEEMALHEFGHSFGDLCDEYIYSTDPSQYRACANCRPSCTDLGPFGSECEPGCDAAEAYFRPEASVMFDLLIPGFNNVSINSPAPLDGLAPRLQYFTTDPGGANGAPTGLTADVVGNHVTLRRNGSTTVSSYTLQVGVASGVYGLLTLPLGNGTTISGMAPNGRYFWRVVASYAGASDASSAEAQFAVPFCATPGVPQNFAFSLAGRAVTLTWDASAGSAPIAYVVDVGSASGLSNILNGAPLGSGTSITVVAPPGAYYVRLRAQNGCGSSGPSVERLIVVP